MEYDIVVGVSTKNCDTTIENILKVVDKTLVKHFSKYTSIILCCDGFSEDNTKQIFNDTKTKTDKKIITEKGKRSKGSSVKTIIQRAKDFNFKVVLFIDGDLVKIKEEWIKKLIFQVLEKGNDLAIASYLRDKNDSLITNHVIYPLTKSLFNVSIKEPMAGELCLSRSLCLKLIGSNFFPADSSINLFINLTAICEGFKVIELKLGSREHTSSDRYSTPENCVIPRFNQIIKTLIQLMRYYKTCITRETKHSIKKSGSYENSRVKKIIIPIESYKEFSRDYIKNEKDYVSEIYRNLNKQSITGLKVAWLNWLCIYFEKTKKMSNKDAEKEITKLAKEFNKQKGSLKL